MLAYVLFQVALVSSAGATSCSPLTASPGGTNFTIEFVADIDAGTCGAGSINAQARVLSAPTNGLAWSILVRPSSDIFFAAISVTGGAGVGVGAGATAPALGFFPSIGNNVNNVTTSNAVGSGWFSGSAPNIVGGSSVTNVTVSGVPYTITITGINYSAIATVLSIGSVTITGGIFGGGGDTTAPRVSSITRQSPATSPTAADTLTWRVTFDEDVQNVGTSDFTRTGTTGTISNVTTVNASTYDVTVSGGDLAGLNATVTLGLNASHNIQDLTGNVLTDTTPTGTNDNFYVVDGTAPTLAQVTPVPTPSNDTTPSYTFSSDEAGAITVGGNCSLGATNAAASNNTITFDALAAGTHSNCTVTVTDAAGNASAPLSVSSFTIDTGRPAAILSFQDNPLSDSTNSTSVTINFTENVTGFELSDLVVSGGTLTDFTSTSAQNYAVKFTATDGVEVTGSVTLAGFKFTDLAGNTSGRTASANVTIDTLNPTLAQVTPVPTPASNTTPSYTFSSDEAGPITVGGDCKLGAIAAISGNNTITFDALAAGTHSNCTVTVTDAAGNASNVLSVPSFTIDTGAPTLISFTRKTPASATTDADTLVFLATFDEDMVNVGTNDFEVNGSTATIISVAQVTASTYDITVSGGDLAALNGSVGVNVVASPTIADGVGNALATGEPATDETYGVINNTAPVIAGGATVAVSVAENQSAVSDVQSTDVDGDTEGSGLSYTLSGGADDALFDIVAATGLLTFKAAPDFETKADVGANGVYDVQVTVTDSGGLTDVQDIEVTVSDVEAVQTISFTNPGAQTFSAGGAVPLTVTGGGSGNAVTLVSTTTGVCTVSGSTVTMVSVGTCTIDADQAAGNDFAAATQVSERFAIGLGANVIAFTGPADTDFTVGSVGLSATASSGLVVSFASTTAPVCTVSGSIVTLVSVGTCSITASQAGSADFVAATDVVRSFAITGDTVITKTKAIASNFVSRRAGRILSGTPDIASRLRRSGGGFSGATGFSPLGFSGSGSLDNAKLAFSTSLRQVVGAGNASKKAQRRELGEMMALGEQSLLSQYNIGLQPGFDIWVKGSLDHATSDNRKSDLSLLFIGADYHLSQTTLVGVLAQLDWSDEKDTTNAFTTDGRGWMAGPYLATRLGENLLFDGRAAYGQSSNHISPLGTYEDSFDTTRWLVSGTLTGDFNQSGWRFSPHVGVSYFEETQKAYTDSIGNNITAQTISLGRMTFGPEISTSFTASNGTLISPHIGVKGIWDFEKAQVIDLNTGLASGSDNDLRASIEAGLTMQLTNGWRLAGEGHYDGIGDDSLEAYGGSVKLTVPLN